MLHFLHDGVAQSASAEVAHSESLTRAQLAVVDLVAAGLPNKEIAHQLGIGEATVKAHVGQAIKRLDCTNRVQLAVWYVKMKQTGGDS